MLGDKASTSRRVRVKNSIFPYRIAYIQLEPRLALERRDIWGCFGPDDKLWTELDAEFFI